MTRSKTGLFEKRSVALLCCLLSAVLLFSGCGRLRERLAGETTPSAAPAQTQAVTPSASIAPVSTATPVQTVAQEEASPSTSPVATPVATPDVAQAETLANVLDDLNGMQNALEGLDEPSDTDLLVP